MNQKERKELREKAENTISISPNNSPQYLMSVNPQAILSLLDRLDRYEETLKFYANPKSWVDRWVDFGGDDDVGGDVFDVIQDDDVNAQESEKDFDGNCLTFGGERARKALEGGE